MREATPTFSPSTHHRSPPMEAGAAWHRERGGAGGGILGEAAACQARDQRTICSISSFSHAGSTIEWDSFSFSFFFLTASSTVVKLADCMYISNPATPHPKKE